MSDESEEQKLLPVERVEAFELEGPSKIKGWTEFHVRSMEEAKEMWEIAAPAILTSVAQFSIGFITTAYIGPLGQVELAAVSIVQNVLEGFVFGAMLGMGSAVETLSGQAVGAGDYQTLGIHLQRSFIITFITALFLTPLYLFTSPLLKIIHQDEIISEAAGNYAIWVIPQLFAYAFNFPIQKFLQAQSKVWVMSVISVVVVGFHTFLNWLLVFRYGLIGAAIAGNISWWIIVFAQMIYIVSGFFPESWTGLSFSALTSLFEFLKISLASALMLCLETWYPSIVIILVGWLPKANVAVDAISICANMEFWTLMITYGFSAAVSVRVSNELGAGNHRAAKLAVGVTLVTSTLVGIMFAAVTVATKDEFPKMFTSESAVIKETAKLGYFLAVAILINSIQPVLHGVAVGAGWQTQVGWINAVCYYLIGLPAGGLLGFKFQLGLQGIWFGVLSGLLLQTLVLLLMLLRTNWSDEVSHAEERIQLWTQPYQH
ncbi:protein DETOXIFICATION 33-like [Silene latifolia]|uniref:protein DETOXIFICATION 33-like n=1 Tax=Silene latifolia TaxID=37657 RepID=UPI003D77E320